MAKKATASKNNTAGAPSQSQKKAVAPIEGDAAVVAEKTPDSVAVSTEKAAPTTSHEGVAAKTAPKNSAEQGTPASKTAACQCASKERPGFIQGTPNPYLPMLATVIEVITETPTIKTFRVVFQDSDTMDTFHFEPGQVGQLSVFGSGESTFVINSPPTRKEYLQFSVMRTGKNTAALHDVQAGDTLGVRAPLGNYFPYESMKDKDIVFVGGGIGMAPLRTLLLFMLDNRSDYGKISLLYGARSPQDMAYSYELPEWLERKDLDCVLTIDREAEGWQHKVGLIPNVLKEMEPSPKNSVAIVCGPPIMIKFTLQALDSLGFKPDQIVTTLERRMKCGVGICGRCNIGDKYVCIDGPVFTVAELNGIPNEL